MAQVDMEEILVPRDLSIKFSLIATLFPEEPNYALSDVLQEMSVNCYFEVQYTSILC